MPKSATGAQGRSGATARPAFTVCVVTAAERMMGSRAVARLLSCAPVAPSGITRSWAFSALWHLALSGIRRPPALRRYGRRRSCRAPLLSCAAAAGAVAAGALMAVRYPARRAAALPGLPPLFTIVSAYRDTIGESMTRRFRLFSTVAVLGFPTALAAQTFRSADTV